MEINAKINTLHLEKDLYGLSSFKTVQPTTISEQYERSSFALRNYGKSKRFIGPHPWQYHM